MSAEPSFQETIALLEKAQEVAHIGSWVTELDGSDRLTWSAESYRIFGVPVGEFTGAAETFYGLVHADDRAAVRAATAVALMGGQPYAIEHRIVRADGSIRWVQERADIVRDAAGRPLRMVGTVQDITERRQLEEQLLHAQKMEAVGRLAGGIAHDMNNALTAIAGYAELALNAIPTDHPAHADVDEIRRAAERAGSVTRQLLAFSRKQIFDPRVFDLNDTMTELARMLTRLLGANIALQTEPARTLPPVLGDRGQLEQAIINLAVNARDAMPDGGTLRLTTSLDEVDEAFAAAHPPMTPGRYVVLTVRDTGHGMSHETQAHVFEPFFTTKDASKGTGLGLAMVYGTITQAGGFVFVASEVGQGSTFRLYLPPAPAETRPISPARLSEKGRGETVLVVEDEPSVRSLVSSALTRDGYQLLIAASADEALRIVAETTGRIDLLLTDAIMPGKSGIELANLLAAERPELPVILMSGYTEHTLDLTRLERPAALLQKPFAPRELRRRIREVLDAVRPG